MSKKLYLDTSVISYLHQKDSPIHMATTLKLWELIKLEHYDVYISDVTVAELFKCKEPKRSILSDFLTQIEYTHLPVDSEAESLAAEIVSQGILTQKSLDDCLHISIAILNDCNIIASWNFKHLVNERTIDGVRMVTLSKNLRSIDIYSPTMLIEGSE